MTPEREKLLRAARLPCPKCKRKGVGYAPHPHAFGWKDYGRASCRYCHTVFKIKEQV
jgi:hypothetical protein